MIKYGWFKVIYLVAYQSSASINLFSKITTIQDK
jgi:hypothetical protein